MDFNKNAFELHILFNHKKEGTLKKFGVGETERFFKDSHIAVDSTKYLFLYHKA